MSENNDRPSLNAASRILRERIAQATLPSDSYARLQERASAAPSPRRLIYAAIAFAACGVLAVGWWVSRAERACGFEIVAAASDGARCSEAGVLETTLTDAALRVSELGVDLQVRPGTRIAREGAAVRLQVGEVSFVVTPRPGQPPLRVLVEYGAIEVVGTSFTVEEAPNGGSVRVVFGHVRFVAASGAVAEVSQGEILHWPLTPASPAGQAPAPEVQLFRGAPVARRVSPAPAPALLAELQALRIRHEYPELIARLSNLVAEERQEPWRERLSYELCDTLAHHGEPPSRACECATEHMLRYPQGDYAIQLSELRRELRCQ